MEPRLKSLAFTSLGHFANDGTALLYPILIIFYVELPGVQIPYLGAMAVVFNLISGMLSTPIGRYADNTGRYGVLISLGISLLGFAALVLALPFVFPQYTLPIVLSGAFLLGSGQAFYHPLGAAIIRNTFDRGGAPRAMGFNGSFGSLGRAIMPTTVGFMMTFIGHVTGLVIYAIYSFVSAVILYLGLRTIKITVKPRAEKKPTPEEKMKLKAAGRGYMSFVYILTSAVFIRALFLTGTSTFIPTYLDQQFGSKTLTLTIILIAYLLPVFGQPMFGSLTAQRGGKFTVTVTFIFSTIFFAGFLLAGNSVILTIAFFALFAGTAYSGFPVLLGFVGQVVPKERIGTSNALVWGLGQTVGGALGAGIVSLFTTFMSVPDAIRLMFIFALIALVFIPLLPSQKKVEDDNKPVATP